MVKRGNDNSVKCIPLEKNYKNRATDESLFIITLDKTKRKYTQK